MRRTLEAIFRHPIQLLLLIIILSLVGVGVVFALPRSYTSTAKLWALRSFENTGATSSDPNAISTPAQSQQKALGELLQTRIFALTVAHETPSLLSALSLENNGPALKDDALFVDLSKHVQVVAEGNNLFTISYTSTDPNTAQQVVAAVIQNYNIQSRTFSTTENQSLLNLLKDYENQQAIAKHDSDVATTAESQYLAAHPNQPQSVLLNDPHYVQLHTRTEQSQTTLQDVQNSINTISQEIATAQGLGNDSLFSVLDAPAVPNVPISRTTQFITGGVIGLAVALLACALYLFIVVRRDRSIYTAYDLHNVTTFPTIIQIPYIASAPLLQSVKVSTKRNA